MKSLVLSAVILALCLPSYGAVVVYKLAQTAKPVIDFNDVNENTADVLKTKIETFIVFNVNVANGDIIGLPGRDANDPTAVLLFKKDKQFMVLGGSDPNSSVSIDNFNTNDSIAPFTVLNKKNTLETLLSVQIRDNDTALRLDAFDLIGKNTSASIGLADKVSFAKSLKGFGEIHVPGPGPIIGFGSAKLTLSSKYTKPANEDGLTVAQTVAEITSDLETEKHFTATQTLPALD